MELTINGESRAVPDGLTVAQLLEHLRVAPERVVVELNLAILKRAGHSVTVLQAGDRVEIVRFIGGGAKATEKMTKRSKPLVIVESPTKAKTINKILGAQFDVVSSMGHLRDLPKSRLGVDVEHDFEPQYIVIQKRRKFAKALQAEARNRDVIYLAPDPDREGEAISWHLGRLLQDDEAAQVKKRLRAKGADAPAAPAPSGRAAALSNGRKIYRVVFHEITPQAVKAALRHPGTIDLQKVEAQQARRVLDRLVGYSLSPLLWRKIGRGLSAGRVQSVALRLVVDREKEIEAFVPTEYWTIIAALRKTGTERSFRAQLERRDDQKLAIGGKEEAERLVADLRRHSFVVASVEEKDQRRHPKPPFITSSLQQEAFHKLGFSSARTMRIAQQLYEGVEIGEAGPLGLITYMRTDSVRIAQEAVVALRRFITERFGAPFVPEQARAYKSRKTAQEAHEAIRPTDVTRTPESLAASLTPEQASLYQLIWQRALASQMSDAVDRVVAVEIGAGPYRLKANGRTPVFAGWTAAYQEGEEQARSKEPQDTGAIPEEDNVLPPLAAEDRCDLLGITPGQHFTKPPRRYTDASLVKTLEEEGIGRPSTYAPIIQTLLARDYVRRPSGSFVPTSLGRTVTEMLVEHFPEVLDLKFTAAVEEELDQVEEGTLKWVNVVRQFYTPFSSRVAVAQEKMKELKREVIPTSYVCEACGKPMVIKWGRFGQFLSCSGYPECKTARPVPTGVSCPQPGCGGDLVERRAKGRTFYGCSKYPTCHYTTRRLTKGEGEEAPPTPSNPESSEPSDPERDEA